VRIDAVKEFFEKYYESNVSSIINPCYEEALKAHHKTILDIGCGTLEWTERNRYVVGIEISENAAYQAKSNNENCDVVLGCAEKLPFRSNSFECVILSEVLEFVENATQTLKEVSRVLKKSLTSKIYVLLKTKENIEYFWKNLPIKPKLVNPKATEFLLRKFGGLRKIKEKIINLSQMLRIHCYHYYSSISDFPLLILQIYSL